MDKIDEIKPCFLNALPAAFGRTLRANKGKFFLEEVKC